MSVVKQISCVLVLSFSLIACSSKYASNTDNRYLESLNGPNLVVPAPMTTENLSYFYTLPPQNKNAEVSIKVTSK